MARGYSRLSVILFRCRVFLIPFLLVCSSGRSDSDWKTEAYQNPVVWGYFLAQYKRVGSGHLADGSAASQHYAFQYVDRQIRLLLETIEGRSSDMRAQLEAVSGIRTRLLGAERDRRKTDLRALGTALNSIVTDAGILHNVLSSIFKDFESEDSSE